MVDLIPACLRNVEKTFDLQGSSQGGQVENLKPFHFFLGCVPNLGYKWSDSDNSSLVDPDLDWGLAGSAVPYLPELMESSINPLNSLIKISVNGSIATGRCAKVEEIIDLLSRLTVNL